MTSLQSRVSPDIESLPMDAIEQHFRDLYGDGEIPLHRPVFGGAERQYLVDCIDSNFVSSVGAKVTEFEQMIERFTGAQFAVATVNGTAALHIALKLAGVMPGDAVLTQAVTFVATCNAISYCSAEPIFVDVDLDTLGMSADALRNFLRDECVIEGKSLRSRATGRRIAACLPMHTFGIPARVDTIAGICADFGVPLVEDAAESLGSSIGERHTGRFGQLATLSFNGNKIITTGGGGMIITDDAAIAKQAKHLTTTAKRPHAYEFDHDETGYNYRLPNLNAALGCAQMEQLPYFLDEKRRIADRHREFFASIGVEFIDAQRDGVIANNWLNAILMPSREARDAFLIDSNARGIGTRPIWKLMPSLPMYARAQRSDLRNSHWLEDRVVNIPSSAPDKAAAFAGRVMPR